jgi:signal peptidase I
MQLMLDRAPGPRHAAFGMNSPLSFDPAARTAHLARATAQKAVLGTVVRLVGTAALLAIGLRALVYEPFNIPSPSMLPRLLVGDYLFVAKWPYGYGRYSFPLGLPLVPGRIAAALPARGDIIVFKTPRDNRTDFIKRVIGLPGDRVAMQDGVVVLNGRPVGKQRRGDVIVPARDESCFSGPGRPDFRSRDTAGNVICRYPAFIETLDTGKSYVVIDQMPGDVHDTTETVIVPAGHVYVLGDNRDDSADSRFSAAEGGVGLVPTGNIIGRADRIFFSVAPVARLSRPATWGPALRPERIGSRL